MSSSSARAFGALFVVFASAAAAAPPQVEDIRLDRNRLTIGFDQPMRTWSGDADGGGIVVSPAADCRWYWESDTSLACTGIGAGFPDPFAPATTYRVRVDGLWSQAGEPLVAGEREVVADPPSVEVRVASWDAGWPTLDLTSALALTAADLRDALEVRLDGEPLPYALDTRERRSWEADEWPEGVAFLLRPEARAQPGTLVVRIRAGLRAARGDAVGVAKDLYRARVGEPFASLGWWCFAPENDVMREAADLPCLPSTVTLVFSRRPTREAREALVARLPPGVSLADGDGGQTCGYGCSPEDGAPRYGIDLQVDGGDRRLALTLPAGFEATTGERLAAPVSLDIPILPSRPGLRIEPPLAIGIPGTLEVPAVTARNLDGASWTELSIGRRVTRDTSRVRGGSTREKFVPVRAPRPDRRILRDGGLSIGGEQRLNGARRGVAVAPFQLLAASSGGQVVVWASEWSDAAPVAGADIEVLRVSVDGSAESLGHGRTGDDGVAIFDATPGGTGTWDKVEVARAIHGRRTTVVPLSWDTRLDTSYRRGGRSTGGAPAKPQFGAVARQLYRPGETVDYRLWLRRREGNRLVARGEKEIALELASVSDRIVHRTWTASLDEWGSTQGQVALPTRLPDGTYCIGEELDWDDEGACFEVARFDDQALFAEATTPATIVRGGDRVDVAVRGDWYSGGPAAHALLRVDAVVHPEAFESVYPAYAGFEFGVPGEDEISGNPMIGADVPARLDAQGRAAVAIRLPDRVRDEDAEEGEIVPELGFGKLLLNPIIGIEGEAMVASPSVQVRFAQYARYVGIRSDGWLRRGADPVLEATVVGFLGDAQPGVPVNIRIEHGRDDDITVLARCVLQAGTPAPCPFRAPENGVYRIVAEAADAGPAQVDRWFGDGAPAPRDAAKATLEVVGTSDGRTPARVRLRHPYARAVALVTVEYDRVRAHFVRPVDDDETFAVPMRADWAPGVSVHVVVRPVTADAAAGWAAATLETSVDVALPRAARGKIALEVVDPTLAPGEAATLRLRNDADGPRLVTIAIVDDSVHQQTDWRHESLDPARDDFLGSLDAWSLGQWHALEALDGPPSLPFQQLAGKERFARAAPTSTLGPEDEATELDTIEVTGSRLKRAEIMDVVPVREHVVPTRRVSSGPADARTRHRFADTAYWNPGVVMAAGESREIAVPLADNLTRWRVLAWSADAGDGFSFAQATLTASLPLELRLGVPTHLYEGDRSRATVGARAADGADTRVRLVAGARGAGVEAGMEASGRVAAHAVLTRDVALVPTTAGDVDLTARADAGAEADAVSGRVPVHSRRGERVLAQAGWLASPVELPTPLPAHARDGALHVDIGLGAATWRRGWIDALRDYPHRCWEQMLSRGLGAALALQDDTGRAAWPDAAAAVAETLAEASSFRDDEGSYHYFVPDMGRGWYGAQPRVLNAWTLRAFGLLRDLGHDVPKHLFEGLPVDTLLPDHDDALSREELEAAPQAAAALAGEDGGADASLLRRLHARWSDMSWLARSELTRALQAEPATADLAAKSLAALRDAGTDRGVRRLLADPRDFGWAMGSDLRDQCAVAATLWDLDRDPATLERRRALLRGVQDLYAGGTPSLDTQASVHCLLAVRAAQSDTGAGRVELTLGTKTATLAVSTAQPAAAWDTPLPTAETLRLQPVPGAASTMNYVAELRWQEDLARAEATGVGLSLERHYAVLRGDEWVPITQATPRVGDWVRVQLQLTVPATRHFVAITDPVPGGWQTRDLELSGVGSERMRALGERGSWWFDTRQTGAMDVRLYAEFLPKGRHVANYYAQVVHPGDYFAPPATAELMYGRASRSTTAPDTIRIAE